MSPTVFPSRLVKNSHYFSLRTPKKVFRALKRDSAGIFVVFAPILGFYMALSRLWADFGRTSPQADATRLTSGAIRNRFS